MSDLLFILLVLGLCLVIIVVWAALFPKSFDEHLRRMEEKDAQLPPPWIMDDLSDDWD